MIFLQPEELLLIFISCISALLETNSFSFCLSGNIFISPFILKDVFTGFRILGRKCFSFYPFSTLSSAFIVSDEKLVFIPLVPSCMMCPFSLAAFDVSLDFWFSKKKNIKNTFELIIVYGIRVPISFFHKRISSFSNIIY